MLKKIVYVHSTYIHKGVLNFLNPVQVSLNIVYSVFNPKMSLSVMCDAEKCVIFHVEK